MSKRRDGGDTSVLDPRASSATGSRAAKPPLYKVLLHNDDFTPRMFVVLVLSQVFGLGEGAAQTVMLHAHQHGLAVVGLFTHEIAESKVRAAMALAKEAQFPLRFTFEAE